MLYFYLSRQIDFIKDITLNILGFYIDLIWIRIPSSLDRRPMGCAKTVVPQHFYILGKGRRDIPIICETGHFYYLWNGPFYSLGEGTLFYLGNGTFYPLGTILFCGIRTTYPLGTILFSGNRTNYPLGTILFSGNRTTYPLEFETSLRIWETDHAILWDSDHLSSGKHPLGIVNLGIGF